MATKKKETKTKAKFLKKYKYWLLILVAVVGFLGYRYTSIYLEKLEFEDRRAKLEQLADKVSAQYPPDQKESSQYCDYSNQKNSKGDLSCVVSIKLSYSVNDVVEANALKSRISLLASPHNLVNNFKSNKIDFDIKDGSTTDGYITQQLQEISYNKCNLSYSLTQKNNTQNVNVNISCVKSAKAEHYPIKD